jgi:hypothetical protein
MVEKLVSLIKGFFNKKESPPVATVEVTPAPTEAIVETPTPEPIKISQIDIDIITEVKEPTPLELQYIEYREMSRAELKILVEKTTLSNLFKTYKSFSEELFNEKLTINRFRSKVDAFAKMDALLRR